MDNPFDPTFQACFVGIDDVMALIGENIIIFSLQKYGGCLHAFKVTKIDENSFALIHLFLWCPWKEITRIMTDCNTQFLNGACLPQCLKMSLVFGKIVASYPYKICPYST